MRVDVAVILPPAEMRHGGAPFRRIGIVGSDVGGDFRAGEEINGDGLGGPFGDVDAAADGVEAGAVGSGIVAHVRAPGVLFLSRSVAVAIRCVGSREGTLVPDGAAGVGVQGHLIRLLRVDALDDVDLARLRPGGSGAEQPEGGPGAAGDGHVCDVGDEEALVEGFVGADADAAAAAGALVLVVDAEVAGVAEVGNAADEAGALGGVVAGVGDEAVGGVGVGEGGEVAEEGVFLVVVGEGVGC